ncbi:hypothetical protein ACSBR1_010818 [Camellia fascicularis]
MLSGSLPEDLCVFLPKLEFLRLSENEFDGQIPTTLGECRELQIISLSYNKFSGFIPKTIGNLTLLQILGIGAEFFWSLCLMTMINEKGSAIFEFCIMAMAEKLLKHLGNIPNNLLSTMSKI